jgi:hypothetical protein
MNAQSGSKGRMPITKKFGRNMPATAGISRHQLAFK